MCFSSSASFGAGIILSVIGVTSIKKIQEPSQIFFASIPLIFAIQQITEGFLWLALSNPNYALLQWSTTYIFLFFAQVVWPFWVPYAIFRLEKEERRKKIEKILVGIGVLVSLYFGYCLLSCDVEAIIEGQHISYKQGFPSGISRYGGLIYIVATVVPHFLSSIKKMWTLGLVILISYVITIIFYKDYIVSVWCFFATVISIAVVVIMFDMKKSNSMVLKPEHQ